jgi:sugar phosphate isomerase/epimerase
LKYPFIHSLAETKELIAEIGNENVGIILDSWHWYTARETKSDLLSLKAREVIAVDLNDAPSGIAVEEQIDSRRMLPMATGVIDLQSFMEGLIEIGFDGPIRAEPFNEELRRMHPQDALAATAAAMKKSFDSVG